LSKTRSDADVMHQITIIRSTLSPAFAYSEDAPYIAYCTDASTDLSRWQVDLHQRNSIKVEILCRQTDISCFFWLL